MRFKGLYQRLGAGPSAEAISRLMMWLAHPNEQHRMSGCHLPQNEPVARNGAGGEVQVRHQRCQERRG